MPTPAIPPRDADFDGYLYNWSQQLTADPTNFGMQASDAIAIAAEYTAWHAAYLAATNILTRTRSTILAKDMAKLSSLSLLREQYNIIKANPAVADAAKVGIGIRVSDPTPTPIPAPTTYPLGNVTNVAPSTQRIMLVDQLTPDRRSKPAGVLGCILMAKVDVEASIDPTGAKLVGVYTRVPFDVGTDFFIPADRGKWVSYFPRWTNAKGEEGPFGPAMSAILT